MSSKFINPEFVYINQELLSNRKIEIEGGRIIGISADGDASDNGIYLPGFVNVHSHAFQRGLRGRGETFIDGKDSFWGWREHMYSLVNELDKESMLEWCIQAFKEMRSAGITSVGEFHYLHHESKKDYAFDEVVLQAAQEVGIRIVLLHSAYMHGSVNQDLHDQQQRFNTTSLDQWWSQVDSLKEKINSDLQKIGVAAHSIRAVDPESIGSIAEGAFSRGMPLHLHVEEQRQEIEASLEAYGKTPMAILNECIESPPLVTAVHCTHTAEADLEQWLSLGGNICICPLTEANLADGIFSMQRVVSHEGCLSLGSDSNARISMIEEMRLAEYVQRLAQEQRGICSDSKGSMADWLLQAATINGARSLGIQAGAIEIGRFADFAIVDYSHEQLAGVEEEHLLAAICCGGDNSLIAGTLIAGE